MDIEKEAEEWLRSNKTKSKNLGNKTQRAHIAAVVLAGLLPIRTNYAKHELIKEALLWADLIMEYS
jgi:hypothetical protein